jgi:signal transduction histidine kinase
VASELSARIFEPHVRGGVDIPGAGLGLSIARGIVGAHGGSLAVRPTDRGVAFVVTLPTEPAPEVVDSGVALTWTMPTETDPHVV